MLNVWIPTGLIFYIIEYNPSVSALQAGIGLILFISVFLGGCYINIYLLTPRYLIKEKWGKYFASMIGLVITVMALIILIQGFWFSPEETHQISTTFMVIINLLSAFFSFNLLFIGTSTIVLFRHWVLDTRQADELESATMQMELKLLENQINPHFLFNMLNNANIMIKKDPDTAIHIIAKLEEMLHYQMNDSAREKVYLKEEILFLDDYLELERTRRDGFNYRINKKGDVNNIQTPPLLFITFVENAVKHNADSQSDSYVDISFSIEGKKLVFVCENSIPRIPPARQAGGIGLVNIRRRLNLLYGTNYSLENTKTDTKYTVRLELKL